MQQVKQSETRKRLYEIVEIGAADDALSRSYDFFGVGVIIVYLAVSVMSTFAGLQGRFGAAFDLIEHLTVAFFVIDYALRLYTAHFLRPRLSEGRAVLAYMLSFTGIIDLFSFLPYFLPFFFPAGAAAFRMFRVVRIFRLFRINTYYDSLNVITEVLDSKKQQLLSSVFIIAVLMLAASLCMYSLEHDAQPEVFQNAFSGIWWAVSTLLTVGYGDIYPITPVGRLFSIILTFLGVLLVAIPTGILSAGFVDQYAKLKRRADFLKEIDVNFIKVALKEDDDWVGKKVRALALPQSVIVAVIRRGRETIVPRGDIILQAGDTLVLGAEPYDDSMDIEMKESVLGAHNPWIGMRIRDLDISRQTLIVLVKRGKKIIIPNGNLVFRAGDKVILYSTGRAEETGV